MDDIDNPLNRSYSSAASMSSAGTGNASSSSKAVLAALRALQDKIRRLEAERTQALDETTQLRHQLKNQELEAEHNRQKEQMSSQKSLQEVRGAYDRLLTEKSELEVRLTHMEEKNRQAQISSDEMQAKIRALEEEKHSGMLRIKELEGQHQQIEIRIKHAQQKEQDLAHSLTMEARRHEDNVQGTQQRLAAIQEELASVCHDKGLADAKLIELDQLVTQLLSVNESLVAQMSGRPVRLEGPSTSAVTKKKTVKKTSAPLVPRAASATTTALEAGRVEKYSKRQGSQLVPVNLSDVEQLKSMHKMYATMAKNIHKSVEALGAGSGKKKKIIKKTSSSSSMGETKKIKNNTRVSRKKAATTAMNTSGASNTSKAPIYNYGNGSNMDIRLPKPTVSFDNDRIDVSDAEDNHGYLYSSSRLSSNPPLTSSHYDASMVSSVVDQHRDKAELHSVINSLEQEFDDLNAQYKKLLSNVQAAPGSKSDVSIIPSSASTTENIQAQAEEIVDVIRQLHKKGEQLRQLKASP